MHQNGVSPRCQVDTYHPSLSAAFTFTPKSSRNFTMWWWPAHTALCKGVIPSSFGLLGSSTYWNHKRVQHLFSKKKYFKRLLFFSSSPHIWFVVQDQILPPKKHPGGGPVDWTSLSNHGLFFLSLVSSGWYVLSEQRWRLEGKILACTSTNRWFSYFFFKLD